MYIYICIYIYFMWGKILFRFLIRKPGRSLYESKQPCTMPIHAGLVPRAATDLIRSSLLEPAAGREDISDYMGLSENRVPLNPMINDHYPY